ncbi:hypothetical protein LVO79_07020 [Roseivivax marinus]|uniref:hypothetical protein n=1 Tax=Roseivivax marinus TaxID=1379903 RepID=UPI001F045EFF|nr:hypothetical protein [Roseivivax marinus]UMA66189.1 hypothetical protein LVO79_07020 [Roseivivax marinus]
MPTCRQEAAEIIAAATRDLPDDLPKKERKKVVDAACPAAWRTMNWPQKAWQAARRDYLVRHGYIPKTKPKESGPPGAMPLFDRSSHQCSLRQSVLQEDTKS